MEYNKLIILLIVFFSVLLVLVVIFFLLRIGIIGSRNSQLDIRVIVNGGMDIDRHVGMTKNTGLIGFENDPSGTLIVATNQKKEGIYICFINQVTGRRYGCRVINTMIVGRVNTRQINDFLEIPEESSISKNHLSVMRDGNHLYVQDLQSTYHTWVNEIYLEGQREIFNNDRIRLGGAEYRIEIN